MNNDTTLPFSFPAACAKKISVAFDGGCISSDGGGTLSFPLPHTLALQLAIFVSTNSNRESKRLILACAFAGSGSPRALTCGWFSNLVMNLANSRSRFLVKVVAPRQGRRAKALQTSGSTRALLKAQINKTDRNDAVSVRCAFQLPTISAPTVAPSAMSVRRDSPRHMTELPGGGSLARAR